MTERGGSIAQVDCCTNSQRAQASGSGSKRISDKRELETSLSLEGTIPVKKHSAHFRGATYLTEINPK